MSIEIYIGGLQRSLSTLKETQRINNFVAKKKNPKGERTTLPLQNDRNQQKLLSIVNINGLKLPIKVYR